MICIVCDDFFGDVFVSGNFKFVWGCVRISYWDLFGSGDKM